MEAVRKTQGHHGLQHDQDKVDEILYITFSQAPYLIHQVGAWEQLVILHSENIIMDLKTACADPP
jgi:hypothetical protein